jgi:hypothetical protein
MSKKTSMNRLHNIQGKAVSAKIWIQRMDDILNKKKSKGMIGFQMSADPLSDGTASMGELARAYCKIEKLREKGFFAKTTSQTL